MAEFILEEQMQKVINPRTKEYLKEVVSSYQNGNYRSCVVVLYTAVIFDLLQKIMVLRAIYNDKGAEKIIKDIDQQQKDKPNSSEWEGKLIEEVYANTKIITAVEKEELLYLKKERNYAAHPIISIDEDKLDLKPITKETAADLIRKAFEIVFLRDSILAKNLFKEIVQYLNEHYSRVGREGLEKSLKLKYFNRMTQERKDKLFKDLWKFVFILENDECNKNRESNYLGLTSLYKEGKSHYRRLIKQDEDFYLNGLKLETFSIWSDRVEENEEISTPLFNMLLRRVQNFQRESRMIFFIKFVEDDPEVYRDLNDYVKNILQQLVRNMYTEIDITKDLPEESLGWEQDIFFKEQVRLQSRAVFLSTNIREHFEMIFKMLKNYRKIVGLWTNIWSSEDLEVIFHQAEYKGCTNEFLKFLIRYCTGASSFYEAGNGFDYLKLYQNHYKEEHYYYILKAINENSQFYDNRNKYEMLNQLKKSYEDQFDCKLLLGTNEEKFLYHNLYNERCDYYNTEKLLKLIEERALCYSAHSLDNIIRWRIDLKKTKKFELLELAKQKKPEDYPNIYSVFSNKCDPDYDELHLEYFKSLFSIDNENTEN